MYLLLSFLFTLAFPFSSFAEKPDLVQPMLIPMELSSNFAELRPNHYHSGVDFKTMQAIGQTIYSVDDGYVSRISISRNGYGNCLYINHPKSGLTSVYAHLDSFESFIDSVIKRKQYADESFEVDFCLTPNQLPVSKGQRVAKSGNSGSSGGPHLHFELRELVSEHALNPLTIYDVKDDVRPRMHKLTVNPIKGKGISAGVSDSKSYQLETISNGVYRIKNGASIKAWGFIGLGLKANDYMTGTSNVYGVYILKVDVDDVTTFNYQNDEISFDSTRYINSFIDYEKWYKNDELIMQTYVQPNAYMSNIKQLVGDGCLDINEERDYNVKMTVCDYSGNKSVLSFVIKGQKQLIPIVDTAWGNNYFPWDTLNSFKTDDISFYIPAGSLYSDIYFNYIYNKDSLAYSDTHVLHYPYVPMQKYADLKIRLKNDILSDKQKYYIAYKNKRGEWEFMGNTYDDGFIKCETRFFGEYKIMCDTIAPTISLLSKGKIISFRVKDDTSGVGKWSGYVDGKWAVFSMDNKTNTISYVFDKNRVEKGKSHKIELHVFDECNNEAVYKTNVWW
ncbi:MAG: M23 family metallopeptidase [Bacteroidia bacterium]|nr:M23 family metallopeptidase [Bacteroidia bacterium]